MRLLHNRWSLRLSMATLLLLPASAAFAQDDVSTGALTWDVGPTRPGWCVYFLMEPKEAANNLTRGHRLVRAADAKDLPLGIQHTIAEDPKYAEWIPSELCTYYVEAVWAGGRRFDKGDKGTPMALTYWGIAAAESQATWNGEMSLRVVGTNSFPLVRLMEVQNLKLDRIPIDRDPDPIAPEDSQYVIKMEGATITFIGHVNPDSVTTPVARVVNGVFDGPVQSVWKMAFTFTPDRNAYLAGSVKIVGKRELAKALSASPIRLLGSGAVGGKGTITFTKGELGKH